jgi:DNA-nicking Smr family endonuclease
MDEQDRTLFRQAMHGVRRLKSNPRQAPKVPRTRPRARFARADRNAVLEESLGAASPLEPVEDTGDSLQYRQSKVSETVFRQLRRGQYRIDAEVDLHGMTAAMVEPVLRDFLADAMQHRARVVRVIHGKGLRSGNRGPVLKMVASNYLRRVGAVLAFASAREVDGGSGAILVLLNDRSRSRSPRP